MIRINAFNAKIFFSLRSIQFDLIEHLNFLDRLLLGKTILFDFCSMHTKMSNKKKRREKLKVFFFGSVGTHCRRTCIMQRMAIISVWQVTMSHKYYSSIDVCHFVSKVSKIGRLTRGKQSIKIVFIDNKNQFLISINCKSFKTFMKFSIFSIINFSLCWFQ